MLCDLNNFNEAYFYKFSLFAIFHTIITVNLYSNYCIKSMTLQMSKSATLSAQLSSWPQTPAVLTTDNSCQLAANNSTWSVKLQSVSHCTCVADCHLCGWVTTTDVCSPSSKTVRLKLSWLNLSCPVWCVHTLTDTYLLRLREGKQHPQAWTVSIINRLPNKTLQSIHQ
jgi:hypothetical protein